MQTLEVISVNLWDIIISLANLIILFLVFKKFLFKPIKNILQKRQDEIDSQYAQAQQAQDAADKDRMQWEQKLSNADLEADNILQNATEAAKYRSDALISEAKQKADSIVRIAQNEAELERKKAQQEIKQEIVAISSAIAEKMLEREIEASDHKALISSFIDTIGDDND